ncbi:MAG: glycosyltransferase family 39 protein, partial [Bacillota bacterium]
MLPFLALFGVKTWVIRLPQLLLGLAALPAAFSVGRRFGGRRGGLCALAVLALSPWHVMLSRWALESNMAPNLLLLGLCFFLKGLEDGRFLPVSALFYGLALYAYSAVWPVMPGLLGLMLLYALRSIKDEKKA